VKRSGLKWSILRLTGIFGPQTKLDPLFFHMPLDTRIEIATTRDTGYALVQTIEHAAELAGRTFNLGGGERCRIVYRDLVERCFEYSGLGRLDFPREAFAEQNFHCGYFADSDELESILHFQRDTLDSYFAWHQQHIDPVHKLAAIVLRKCIKQQMLKQSDPYQALKTRNAGLIRRFFRDAQLGKSYS
jgi:nucleoside-diphosphate-sugar epimerase